MSFQAPDNVNFLSPVGFEFVLSRAPNVSFYCHAATLPSLNLPENRQSTPFVQIPRPGAKLEFEPLDIRFRVDEDAVNYTEIQNWMFQLGLPEDFQDYKDMMDNSTEGSPFSDATLIVHTSNRNANFKYVFEDLFPINLTPLEFDAARQDIEYLEASASFRYKLYKLERI